MEIIKRVHCNQCGTKVLKVTFKKFNGICAKCHKANEREAFLAEGGFPDSKYKVTLVFYLKQTYCKNLAGIDENSYLKIDLISRGPNDYYAIKAAKETLVRRLRFLVPEIPENISFKASGTKVEKITPLTLFSEIEISSFNLSKNKPAIGPEILSQKDLNQYSEALYQASELTITDFLKKHNDFLNTLQPFFVLVRQFLYLQIRLKHKCINARLTL